MKKDKRQIKRLIFFLLIIILFPSKVLAFTLPEVSSKNVLLYDVETGEILYEKNAQDMTSIASLTKIMTTIVALEEIEDLDERVVVTYDMLKNVPWDASVAGLKVNDKVTYKDLLYASILPSGADATYVLAYTLSGSIENFVAKMNELSDKLGLEHTHFVNVTGYDAQNHYSTAVDVLNILLYALKNPVFKEIYETKSYTLSNNLKVYSTLYHYNSTLNYDLSQIIGSKTGYTGEAGLCMSAEILTNNRNLILITMGATYQNNQAGNMIDTMSIINYLNEFYENKILFAKDNILFSIPVKNSETKFYQVKVTNDIIKYLSNDYNLNDVTYTFQAPESISPKNKVGDKLGTVSYYYQNELIAKEDIILDESINFSLEVFLTNHLDVISIALLCLIIIFILLIAKNNKRRKKRKRSHHC